MKLAALCDKDTGVGMMLAGIHMVYTPDTNILQVWQDIIRHDDIGVLFITEGLADSLGKHLAEYRIRNTTPIIIEIPDKKGKLDGHIDFVSHLIKKAVGIEVKK
jgi:V/A-type H+-transporting ATPase subunit F